MSNEKPDNLNTLSFQKPTRSINVPTAMDINIDGVEEWIDKLGVGELLNMGYSKTQAELIIKQRQNGEVGQTAIFVKKYLLSLTPGMHRELKKQAAMQDVSMRNLIAGYMMEGLKEDGSKYDTTIDKEFAEE